MTDIPTTTTQGEALEARARELALACANEACRNMDGILDLGAMERHFTAALQPNIDHAVGGVNLAAIVIRHTKIGGYPDTHAIAADAFELGHALSTPPVKLDAVREAQTLAAAIDQNDAMRQDLAHVSNLVSDLARAMKVDQANSDGSWPDLAGRISKLTAAALATPPLDNTGLDAVRDELTGLPLSEALANERREHDATQRAWVKRDTALREAEGKLAALATPSTDTGLDAATVELKHVAALLLWQYRTDATALPYATEMWKALDAALASGDRS